MIRHGAFIFIAVLGLAGCLAGCSGDDDDSGTAQPDDKAALVARGKYLVEHVDACSDCHTPRDAMGAPVMDQYMAGVECLIKLDNDHCLHSRNLTNDETGLKNRTDDEIKSMFLDGVRPSATGDKALFPMMPYYVFHNMTDEDANSIVAYLRTIPGVDHEVPRSDAEFEIPAPAEPLDLDAVPMPMDDYEDMDAAMRGRYLAAEAGICVECHTKHVMDDPRVLDYDGFFQGGEPFELGFPVTPISKNLTSDEETGLGTWSVDDIVAVLHDGVDKNGDGICPPMPAGPMAAFGGLTDDDAMDIAHYIKSLPPATNKIDDMCTWPPMAP